jgi:hypothetical protein
MNVIEQRRECEQWDATRIGCSQSKTDSDNKKPKERMKRELYHLRGEENG